MQGWWEMALWEYVLHYKSLLIFCLLRLASSLGRCKHPVHMHDAMECRAYHPFSTPAVDSPTGGSVLCWFIRPLWKRQLPQLMLILGVAKEQGWLVQWVVEATLTFQCWSFRHQVPLCNQWFPHSCLQLDFFPPPLDSSIHLLIWHLHLDVWYLKINIFKNWALNLPAPKPVPLKSPPSQITGNQSILPVAQAVIWSHSDFLWHATCILSTYLVGTAFKIHPEKK